MPRARRSGGAMALRHSGTSCGITCSLRDVHRVMHTRVTRMSAARPLNNARGALGHDRAEHAAKRSDSNGDAAVAVADCERARKTLPVLANAMKLTVVASRCRNS